MAEQRISRELRKMKKNNPTSFWAGPVSDDIYHWEGVIIGPENSPYAEGIFFVTVHFPVEYPMKPPKISFKTKVFHPNINEYGAIRLDTLKQNWSPAFTVSKVLSDIRSLLSDPKLDESHPHVPEIEQMCRFNWADYVEIARIWTMLYANV